MVDVDLFQTDYDPALCDIGVIHLGYGAFHRAHQAIYIDDYMEQTGDLRWGIAAVNLRTAEAETFSEAAKAKSGYVVKSISPDGAVSFRNVRSHLAFVDSTSEPEQAYNLLAFPSVKMVTITVTESGYYFDQNWDLDLAAQPITAGIAGEASETVYAYLAEALGRRVAQVDQPVSILCCDNIRSNGRMLEGALLAYLEAKQQTELADWVRRKVSFPCSMVDRITPRSTQGLKDEVAGLFAQRSHSPVHAEDFAQWVIEDRFAAETPDLSKVGVQIVSDVEPYEEAKIRILNGGHVGLAYLGALAGHRTFDQAMRDPSLRPHFERWEKSEVLPGLGNDAPFDTTDYLGEIASRFENEGIADHLERICMDGYSKMAIYIRPTLEACLQKGILPEAGFDCVAAWIVTARRHQNGQNNFPYHEPYWDKLAPMIIKGNESEIASDPQIWGDLPQRFDNFVPGLVAAIQRMDQKWQA